jgi:hypothetical protein
VLLGACPGTTLGWQVPNAAQTLGYAERGRHAGSKCRTAAELPVADPPTGGTGVNKPTPGSPPGRQIVNKAHDEDSGIYPRLQSNGPAAMLPASSVSHCAVINKKNRSRACISPQTMMPLYTQRVRSAHEPEFARQQRCILAPLGSISFFRNDGCVGCLDRVRRLPSSVRSSAVRFLGWQRHRSQWRSCSRRTGDHHRAGHRRRQNRHD